MKGLDNVPAIWSKICIISKLNLCLLGHILRVLTLVLELNNIYKFTYVFSLWMSTRPYAFYLSFKIFFNYQIIVTILFFRFGFDIIPLRRFVRTEEQMLLNILHSIFAILFRLSKVEIFTRTNEQQQSTKRVEITKWWKKKFWY